MTNHPAALATRLDQTAADTEALMAKLLADTLLPDEIQRPKRLLDAMRYGSLNGGKRLRPFLVVESAAMFDVPRDAAPARRRGARMHPLLFADPRRPAVDGQLRPAPRPADRAQGVR